MRIVYKFPCKFRREKMFKTIDNIFSLARTDDWEIVLTLDVDDPELYNEEVIERISNYGGKVRPLWGLSENKIAAVNRDCNRLGSFDVLVLQSDDQVWKTEGFDEQIISDVLIHAPDLDFFFHYPDGAQTNTCTLSIMGRTYFNRTNYIYHPSYQNVFCDNEATDVAKILGKYKYINKNLYEHMHPVWRKGEWDAMYKANESAANYAKDRETYNRRKANNFDL